MCNGHEASVARPVPAPGSEFRSVLVTTGVKTAQRGLAGGRGQEGCATQAIERAGDGKCVTACSTARSSIGASGMKGNSLLVPAPGFSFYGYFGSVKSNCASRTQAPARLARLLLASYSVFASTGSTVFAILVKVFSLWNGKACLGADWSELFRRISFFFLLLLLYLL